MKATECTPSRELPIVPLRGLVVFPDSRVHFEINRSSSIAALKAAMKEEQEIFLVAQKDLLTEHPQPQQLHDMGVIATVRQVLKGSSGEGARVYVEGQCRAVLKELLQSKPYPRGIITPKAEQSVPAEDKLLEKALLRQAKHLFDRCARYISLPPDIPLTVLAMRSAGKLANYIADSLPLPVEEKQGILEETKPLARLKLLCVLLARERELQSIEEKINEQVQQRMEQNQREAFLREQRRAISIELGEGDGFQEEAAEFREQLLALNLPAEQEEKLLKDCARLERMPPMSPESATLSTYLETVLTLPWRRVTNDKLNLEVAAKKLEH
ncbi:MAG: LON peptidase substrate-binding domain-containing protein, partial [Oscillospiraceae bacterium]|nr:LON peptidase substrate-binding domain-containing protein [Oscillospiraceae bacterium]